MGLFDSGYTKKSKAFAFDKIPTTVNELKSFAESDLSSPFKTCALTMLVLLNYQNSVEGTVDMLNFLKGPEPMSAYDIQFLRDRLKGKEYVARSFFSGSSPDNNYTPSKPLQITVYDNPYSYKDEGYATLYMDSTGADSPRSIKFRHKPSTNEWFMVENFALSDIRIPKNLDPWA